MVHRQADNMSFYIYLTRTDIVGPAWAPNHTKHAASTRLVTRPYLWLTLSLYLIHRIIQTPTSVLIACSYHQHQYIHSHEPWTRYPIADHSLVPLYPVQITIHAYLDFVVSCSIMILLTYTLSEKAFRAIHACHTPRITSVAPITPIVPKFIHASQGI